MLRSCTIAFFENQQPTPSAWTAVVDFVAGWNRSHATPFADVAGLFFQLTLTEHQAADLIEILAALRRLRARAGVVAMTSQRDTPDPADYTAADYLEVLGAVLEGDRPLVTNEAETLLPGPPCPACGADSVYDLVQTGPLAIDLTLLGNSDAVDLPGERLLVSARLAALLPTGRGSGIGLRPVLDAATGEPTYQARQLTSDRSVVAPCSMHTRVLGDPFCPVCGTAYGVVEGSVHEPRPLLGGRDVVSRHRSGEALFAFSRRLHSTLVGAGLTGLEPSGLFLLCDHPDQRGDKV